LRCFLPIKTPNFVRLVPFPAALTGYDVTLTHLSVTPKRVRIILDGTLKSVSFIEPDYIEAPGGNDDHAPSDMLEGQRLVARIVRALITSPQWERTMLIITYDEHGGFYDHLVPPDRVETLQPDGTTVTRPIPPIANGIRQLGPRVPAFIVSPFTPGEAPNPRAIDPATAQLLLNVSKRVYEHASIPATILRRFCSPHAPYLSAPGSIPLMMWTNC
jgi:phospholipase C